MEREQDRCEETAKKTQVLQDFQLLFFAMSKIKSFPWTFLEEDLESTKSSDLILDILKHTVLHSLCRKFPPSVKFRKMFLTEIIKRQDSLGCEPLDELYDCLAEVVGNEHTDHCYKTYFLPCGGSVSLSESLSVISEGTTGLVTWEAALHLAEWALDNKDVFKNRCVLELGSGVGLTGLSVCLSCQPKTFTFSDCHHSVLSRLQDNVDNNINTTEEEEERPSVSVRVEEIDWSRVTDRQLQEMGAEVVIAADVVYDPDVVETLVALLSRILQISSPQIYICSTVRNTHTYQGFKERLEAAGLSYSVMEGAVSPVFPYDRTSHIELIQIHTQPEPQ